MADNRGRVRAERVFRERTNWLDELSEREVKEKYRLTKDRIRWLNELIRDEIEPQTNRSHAVNSLTKLLITLQICAKGEFYSEGGLTHGVSKSTVCKHFWQVIGAIDRRLQNIIFPRDNNRLGNIKRNFYRVAHIPNCIGAVDCTLIPIVAPTEREDIFICRKGYHAINVQAVVDTDMRFTNIVARWPGSTHDNVIFENCGLKRWLEGGNHGWLVGDCGYALNNYMLTPKIHPVTRAEISYNTAHSRTRMVVERSFGLLKSRFRCLHKTGGCLQFTPEKCAKVVVVCAKLHNLCIEDGMEENYDPAVQNHNNNDLNFDLEPNAHRRREALINTF